MANVAEKKLVKKNGEFFAERQQFFARQKKFDEIDPSCFDRKNEKCFFLSTKICLKIISQTTKLGKIVIT